MKKDITQIHIEEADFTYSFNTKDFLTQLKGVAISLLNGDVGDAIEASFKVLFVSKSKTTVSYKAFELIYRAITKACVAVWNDEEEHQKIINAKKNLVIKSDSLKHNIKKKLSLSIGPDFFVSPKKQPFVKEIHEYFKYWLHYELGLTKEQARTLSATFPDKFLRELAVEWTEHASYYRAIEEHFKNPFFNAITEEANMASYRSELAGLYSQPVFGDESMTLADIYIEPYFKIYRTCIPEKERKEYEIDEDGFAKPLTTNHLHGFILKYFNKETPLQLNAEASNFLLLLGQPGQGKTSFCSRTLFDLLSSEADFFDNLYLVKLRYLQNVKNALSNPLDNIRKHIAKTEFRSDEAIHIEDLENGILLLDGLDELYMHQGLSNADIKNFVDGLSKELNSLRSLRIVMTTRYNYLSLDDLSYEKYLILRLDELTLKQQTNWLEKYNNFHTCQIDANKLKLINTSQEKKYESIKELINQPILLQMVARANFDIDEKANRSKLYETLFDTLIERRWSRDQQLEKFTNLKKEDLRSFLGDIALHIFYSDFEYIRHTAFEEEEHLKKAANGLLKKMDFQLELKDTVKDILVSFYFRNKMKDQKDRYDKDRHNDYAIEFLHKSLQEYLAAEKIWTLYKTEFLDTKRNGDFIIDDWEGALEYIYPKFSKKLLSEEVAEYLIEIIQNDPQVEENNLLAERLTKFLSPLIERSFILRYDALQDKMALYPIDKGLAVFYSYWTILSYLVEENVIEKFFIKRVADLMISLRRTRYLPIRFVGANLRGANLRGGDLSQADLSQAILSQADLRGADLYGAVLRRADLYGAVFSRADLRSADLRGADFSDANLRGVDLREADLREANLRGVDLREADLREADLREADLGRAKNLHIANFENTIYEGKFIKEENNKKE